MAQTHVKRDDVVVVTTGASKGRSGRVLKVDPVKARVIVEGCNVRKKTVRRSQDNPQGGIIEVEGSVHISNVMLKNKYDARREGAGQELPNEPDADDVASEAQDEVAKQ